MKRFHAAAAAASAASRSRFSNLTIVVRQVEEAA
jgi:ribosomal protein L22